MLPQGHIFPKTLNDFKKSFLSLKNQLVFHYFCSSCLTCLQDKSVIKQCPNQFCQKDLKSLGKGSVNYFLEIPITGQLRTFFARQKFCSYIQYRFKRLTGICGIRAEYRKMRNIWTLRNNLILRKTGTSGIRGLTEYRA